MILNYIGQRILGCKHDSKVVAKKRTISHELSAKELLTLMCIHTYSLRLKVLKYLYILCIHERYL